MSTRARQEGLVGVRRAWTVGLLASQLALGAPALRPAWAGPEGAEVVRGQVQIDTQGDHTVIHASDRSIVEYRSFDIGARESVQFVQPSESARVLNRIESNRPTQIDGALFANGRVYFVNPFGVYFGAGAEVNVAEITAAAGHISNEDFLAGIDRFSGLTGSVQNDGSIHADLVRLVGEHVANRGSISAEGGLIAMVSGNDVLFGEPGSRLYVKVASAAPADPSRPGVEQSGSLAAEGGSVLLAGGDLLGLAISHSGATRAEEIRVAGGAHGVVEVSGSLDASNRSPGGAGGHIEVTGEQVALRGASLDASGDAGGGSVLVGGDFHGEGEVRAAVTSFVDPDTRIRADALSQGDGGKVVVWADRTTGFYGDISARGGEAGGDGGMVEVSGKEHLVFRGAVDTLAPAGLTGSLLLDPVDLTVANGSGDGDADGTTTFAGSPSGITGSVLSADTAPVTVFESELEGLAASTNVLLQATNNLTIQNLTDNLLALPTTGSVSFQAGNAFSMDASDTIRTQGASLDISGASVTLGSLSTRGSSGTLSGAITVSSTGSGNLALRTINAGTGTVSITSGGSMIDPGTTTTPLSDITAGNLSLVTTGAAAAIGTATLPIRVNPSGRLDASTANGNMFISSPSGNLQVGAIGAGTGNVTLSTSTLGAITDDGNPATRIVANTLTLTGGVIGSAALPISTNLAGVLNATKNTAGGMFVSESNGLTLGAIGGGTGIVSLNAEAGAISDDGTPATLVSGGTLTLTTHDAGAAIGSGAAAVRANAGVAVNASTNNGPIFLASQGAALRVGAINAGTSNVTLTGGTGAAAASSIVDDLNPSTRIVANNLSMTANTNGASIGAAAAPIQTTLAGTLTVSATTGAGGIFVSESNGLSVGQVNGGTTKIIGLTAELGSITDDGVLGTLINGGNLTLTANDAGAAIGTSATPMRISLAGNVNAAAPNGPGGIFLTEVNAMNVGAIDAGSGDVTLLTTSGAILDDGIASTFVSTPRLSLTATGTGGSIGVLESLDLALHNSNGSKNLTPYAPISTQNLTSLTAASAGAVVVRNTAGGDLSLDGISTTGTSSTSTGFLFPPIQGAVSIRNDAGRLLVNTPITVPAATDPFPGLDKGSIYLDTPYQIVIGVPSLIAGRNLFLNSNIARDQIVEPRLATIVVYPGTSGDPAADARNLTLSALNGSFLVGEGQTISVPGTLQINAPVGTPSFNVPFPQPQPFPDNSPYNTAANVTLGTATVGDLNALDIQINAEEGYLYLREPRQLFEQNGSVVTDRGGDLVANSIELNFTFSPQMKTIGTGERPTFATSNGFIVPGAPSQARFGSPPVGELAPADFLGLAGGAAGQILDFRASASSTEGSPDAVAPIPYEFRRSDGQLSQLNAEAAAASNVWGADLLAYLRCSRSPMDDPDGFPVACLGYNQAQQTRAPYSTPQAVAARTDYRLLLGRRDALRSSLGAAFDAYRGSAGAEPTGAGFRRFLEETPQYGGALDAVRELGDLFRSLDAMLGAHRAAGGAIQPWQQQLLQDFTPVGMSPALLYEATGASQGVVEAV